MDIEFIFPNTRKSRVKKMEINEVDKRNSMTNYCFKKLFKMQIYSIFDILLS